ncbi:heat shock protein 21 [Penaeus vannamei]|uniref:Heat shock protein 21 n=1 Tax=Penaeus vannamei TaxID=6689 RepID=A0A3R7P683_PENVA|nr:heat shock protein 21 [Penaeus vannamei]
MTETSGNLSASRDFGTSSQDSLLSVIPEDENDSETAEVLHLEDSQQAIDIQDLKNSQESSDIVEVKGSEAIEILDLTESQEDIDILMKDSQGSVDILEVKGSSVEILDLQDSQESVDILDGEDSHETVAEAQNVIQPTDTNTSSTTIAEESAEAIESLKGTRRIQRDSPEELLLITKRGNFFQDSFFLDAHRDFSAALRQVLGRCNQVNFEDDTDLRHTDILERYRQLRSRDLREENQAAIVTSDKSCMKIIMDVHDFMSGDVQAKVVDEKELVIEGLVVKKEEGTSSETSHSFRRRFSLPQFTKITSVMSLDGILTVTVMFKEGNVEANTAENSIKTEAKRITKEIIHSKSPSLPAEKRLLETKNENQNGLNEYMTSQSEETRHFLEISRREQRRLILIAVSRTAID